MSVGPVSSSSTASASTIQSLTDQLKLLEQVESGVKQDNALKNIVNLVAQIPPEQLKSTAQQLDAKQIATLSVHLNTASAKFLDSPERAALNSFVAQGKHSAPSTRNSMMGLEAMMKKQDKTASTPPPSGEVRLSSRLAQAVETFSTSAPLDKSLRGQLEKMGDKGQGLAIGHDALVAGKSRVQSQAAGIGRKLERREKMNDKEVGRLVGDEGGDLVKISTGHAADQKAVALQGLDEAIGKAPKGSDAALALTGMRAQIAHGGDPKEIMSHMVSQLEGASAIPDFEPGAAVKSTGAVGDMGSLSSPMQSVVNDLKTARADFEKYEVSSHHAITSLINSGAPIEMVLMQVMMKLNERFEEKLKLSMKELGAAEALSKAGVNGADFKVPTLQSAMQSVQYEQNRWKQMMDALSAVMRVLQDMAGTPIRNIR